MKLTQAQIQDLYAFTRKHYVVYYDLQTELVDHLANDIEAIWQETPKISFEDAKIKAFKKFGVFGFMEPIEQKQKEINKRYMRYLWRELKAWFTIPKIIITATLFLLFYISFSTIYAKYFAVVFYILIAVWSTIKSFKLGKIFKSRTNNTNKKWMLEEMLFKQAGGVGLIFISQLHSVFNITEKFSNNTYAVLGFASLFTFFVLINYISLQLLPNKAEKLLKETYPEFSL